MIDFVNCVVAPFHWQSIVKKMPAYAALVSLQQTLGIILDSGGLRILGIKGQLQSLEKQVDLFLDFLGNNPGGQIPLESKMRKEAYMAEERIESYINTRLRNSLIIAVCNISYIVLGALFISSYVWIQRYVVWLLASIAVCIIYVAVTRLALNAGNDNESEAGRLRQVLYDFDGIQAQVNGIQQTAQAVLGLLRQTLDSVLASDSGRFISDNCRDQLKSLRDQVRPESQWLKFLKDNEHADVKDAASKVNDFIESKFSVHHSSIWRKFGILIKVSLLASWICLLVLALLITIMLTFIIYKLSFATTSSHDIRVYTLIPLALGIGVHVFIAKELAFQNRSKSLEQELSEEIGSLEKIMNREENASECATPAQDLEVGRNAAVVGLVSDILVIQERLLDYSRRVEVVSIVGMGGIGKTTLAKKVYDDAAITEHFDIRAWVTISQKYTVSHVLQRLLGCINIQPGGDEGESVLGHRLYKALFGRRFLIVIDDLWDTEVWYSVKTYFPRIENGSRLLLTSRSRYQEFAGGYCHEMRHLDKKASWVLLEKTVFGGGSCPENLKDSGKAIAKGCRGLPLAIVVIGRVLPRDNLGEWKKVEEKLMNSQSTKLMDKCLEILGWSYDSLPHPLRPCFLYMGVLPLPTDSDGIPVSKLISLWAAEGFLKPCMPKSSEVVGEEYLKELIDRNMISVSKRSCNGKIRACSIHDLWRRFCVKTAGDQEFLHVVGTPGAQIPNMQTLTLRRLSIYPDAVQVDASSRYLRAFFCSSDRLSNCPSMSKYSLLSSRAKLLNYPSAGFSKFGRLRLRVLDVLVLHCEAFPGQITELVSLRYLALSCDAPLPPSISKLGYLETIVHHHRSDHRYPLLPMAIWSMPNLRHLYVKPGCYLSVPLLHPIVLVPRHLQTLMGIRNFKWSKGIVERIPNLKKLEILYDASSSSSSLDWSAYQLECLVDLSQLEALKITVNNPQSCCSPPTLAFPRQLKKLSLSGCGIPWDSIGALPSLEALKLRCEACSGRSWKTVGDEFPRLMFLLLEKMNLEIWDTEAAHFPCLQRLVLRSCRVLEGIPYIPTLEVIELVGCHSSAEGFAEQIQQQQEEETGVSLRVCVSAA